MIVRIWRTGVDPAREDEYRVFANERSLPMFRRHDGFLGVLFGVRNGNGITVTLWRDERDVEALDRSPVYQHTVEAILATGFLAGDQMVEVYEVSGGDLTALHDRGNP